MPYHVKSKFSFVRTLLRLADVDFFPSESFHLFLDGHAVI